MFFFLETCLLCQHGWQENQQLSRSQSEVAAYGSGLLLKQPSADFLNGQFYKAGPYGLYRTDETLSFIGTMAL